MQLAIQNGDDILPYLESGLSVNCRLTSNMTPLCVAISSGHEDIALMLLNFSSEIDLSAEDKDMNTPLYYACANGMLEVVKELLQRDTNTLDKGNRHNVTPLTRACEKGHLDIVRELLKHSPDVNKHSPMGTPLMVAGIRGHTDIAKELLAVSDLKASLKFGNGTALHDACSLNRYDIVKLLLSKPDIQVNTVCPPWGTALHNAVRKSNLSIVEMMTSHGGIDLNVTDSHGNTPLHLSAITGNVEITEILLSHRHIDVQPRNLQGETPLDCATNRLHTEVVNALTVRVISDRKKKQCTSGLQFAALISCLVLSCYTASRLWFGTRSQPVY
eukprot:TRINITY_DN9459_c0_g1_i1.p1 TRINITY_DN9459_c0_g1~~TRINITY_DN9459_c0_g1_i1.p1  ORF type:complete len:330 (+),score=55.54 TRINITY_DN9459_c0_g1_i1:1605-2594(+)